ncbi:MAG TPA: SAF domain-containing protein [Acidimicrobiales bacterium]|nr:SAF domain-containing protein [Acidimicrobiales bacterium]
MRGRRPVLVRRRMRRRRLPRWLRRHRGLYWVAAIALAVLTANTIATAVRRAEAARDAWGEARSVLVARRRLDIGDVVATDDVATESWPSTMVPRGAIGIDVDAIGRMVVEIVEPGEAVLAGRLAPDGLRGIAALIPPGWRAIAVPVGAAALPLSVGDRLDLVAAVGSTDVSESQSPAFVLAENALVVAADEQSVTVAVPADDAPRVALAIVTGSVVPALRGG